MDERDILLKTIEGLNASIASLAATNKKQAEEKRDEAVEKVEKGPAGEKKQKRRNRRMVEDLPVLETEIIEPTGVDLSLYRKIGEEVTKVVKHKPEMLYVKKIIRPKYGLKDNTQLPPEGQKGVEIAPCR